MYDRRLRQRKEFQLQKFRVAQAELWREDVRDLISLTEYKMHVYLLVNVLMLGFCVVLYCEGKLPEQTPDWLMMGHIISITGAFSFLLLSMWLAMQAAVAAQSYEARLLTQLVRLPIPSWNEIEACRTYGSDFERVDKKQMVRVPFLNQESLVKPAEIARPHQEENESTEDTPGLFPHPAPSTAEEESHEAYCDPWGLERGGAEIEELGCKTGPSIAQLRHVKIARHAMIYWQTFDAFARVSLNIGVNQLLLAMSYYIIGYTMVEVGCWMAATYGIILMSALTETLTRLDMSLSLWEFRFLQALIILGPSMSCVAGYHWTYGSEESSNTAETLIVSAFATHGIFLGIMSHFSRIKRQDNGAMLPVGFRSVLYLDVFGSMRRPNIDDTIPHRLSSRHGMVLTPGESNTEGTDDSVLGHASSKRPAPASVEYHKGKPVPHRPEDAAPLGSVQDMRNVPGAPEEPGELSAHGDAEFFSATSWLMHKDDDEPQDPDDPITTGHAGEPHILPWVVFITVMRAMTLAWVMAAVYHGLGATQVWSMDLPSWVKTFQEPDNAPSHKESSPSLLQRVLGTGGRMGREAMTVTWPQEHMELRSLACDASGRRFVASDGLMLYTAELLPLDSPTPETHLSFQALPCMHLLGEGLQDAAIVCSRGPEAACEAIVLHRHGRRVAACALPKPGMAALTEISDSATVAANISGAWLERLRGNHGGAVGSWAPHGRLEKAVSISIDSGSSCKELDDGKPPSLAAIQGCLVLGTNRGRVVRLQQQQQQNDDKTEQLLMPAEGLRDVKATYKKQLELPHGAVRAFWPEGFAILHDSHRRQAIQVLDGNGGQTVGRLTLPSRSPAGAFCIGGGQLYVLGGGRGPKLWRAPLPSGLVTTDQQE